MIKWLDRLFNKTAPVEEQVDTTVEDTSEDTPKEYDYGLHNPVLLTVGGDYGWSPQKPFRKVILTNVEDCRENISVWGCVSAWRGTGHSEWEFILAINFVNSVVKALENGESEADISPIFEHDLLASGGRVFTQKQIWDHIIRFFNIEDEDEQTIRMSVKVGNREST